MGVRHDALCWSAHSTPRCDTKSISLVMSSKAPEIEVGNVDSTWCQRIEMEADPALGFMEGAREAQPQEPITSEAATASVMEVGPRSGTITWHMNCRT